LRNNTESREFLFSCIGMLAFQTLFLETGNKNTIIFKCRFLEGFLTRPNSLCSMDFSALKSTLHSRRFWIWQICGAIIYSIPALIRLVTGNVVLPVLSLLETPWIDHFVPGNLVEKILVNAFFPGGAGAIAGEIYFSIHYSGQLVSRKRRYGWRLAGALLWVSLWTLFQFAGYLQNIVGSYGGNLFEYPGVYPLNFLLASLSIFTPTVIGFLGGKLSGVFHR
jgi:hypothetical protein